MPQVSKRIYPKSITENRVVQKYYRVVPNGSSSGMNTSYGEYYNVNTAIAYFDTTPLKNAISISLRASISNTMDRVSSTYITGYTPYIFVKVLGYSYRRSFSSSASVDFVSTVIQEIIEATSNVGIEFDSNIVSYKITNSTSYYQNAGYIKYTLGDDVYLEYSIIEPSVTNFAINGTSVDASITCSWNQLDTSSWTVQVLQNNAVVASKSGTTATSCTFSGGEIKKGGTTTFKVIANNSTYDTSFEATKVVNLSEPLASVSNFTVAGSRIDQAITCSWKQNKTYNWKVQAMQGGIVLATKTGTIETTCTFNPGEISKGGDVTFRITASNTWNSAYNDTVKNLTVPTATVKDFSISGTSIDENITCTWTHKDVYAWTVQAIQNGVVKAVKNGMSVTGCTFNAGELVAGGETVFRIIATNTWNSSQVDSIVNLSYTQAKVDILDLPANNVNTDNNFLISWVTQNQTSFKLEIDGKIYTGTTENRLLIPKNTIKKGKVTVKLTIWFTNAYYQNSDYKEVVFTSYGKPDAPTLNIGPSVNLATPTVVWSSDDQVAFRLIIKQRETVFLDTLDTVSDKKEYLITKALSNNTEYTFILKIKSQYGLWSNEISITVIAEFDVPNKPVIVATNGANGSILLHVKTTVTGDEQYKYTEIWKKEPASDWKRMAINMGYNDAWTDFYCGGDIEYKYKAVNIGKTGARVESNIVTATTKVQNYNLYNVEDTSEVFSFKYDVKITPTLIRNVKSNLFAGNNAPKSEQGKVRYYQYSITFNSKNSTDKDSLINLINNSNVILFKDCKGNKCFGKITNDLSFPESDLGVINFTLQFTEEAFIEEDVYNGGFNGITKYPLVWDGAWFFGAGEVYGE